ncbi:MAG: sulfatase-like hydrolase/transferase [Clostridia bacterium]|nr:sulfatase-like hydrolase/transferase [Clostridia bacterium]
MKKLLKLFYPGFLFWFCTLIFYETLLRISCADLFWGVGLLFIPLFSVVHASVLNLFSGIFPRRAQKWICPIFLGLIFLFFDTQLVYHDIFKTYCTLYAALNGGEAFMFFKVMFASIWRVKFYLLASILPVLAYIILGKRIFNGEKFSAKIPLFSLGTAAAGFLLCFVLMIAFGTNALSPYDLYFGTPSTDLSVEKLGTVTTFTTDLRRTVFGANGRAAFIPEYGGLSDFEPDQKNRYNILDIDLAALAQNEDDKTVKAIDNYLSTVAPTEKNSMTGVYKDKNIILLVCESLAPYAIDPQLTPTLYKMTNEGITFTNFYAPLFGTGTSDAEFSVLTGLLPRSDAWAMDVSSSVYFPFTLANQLRAKGYAAFAYHNNTGLFYHRNVTHPNLGYRFKAADSGLKLQNPKAVPASDVEMIEASVKDYLYSPRPFHVYYMTYSGHSPYNLKDHAMAKKHRDLVNNLKCTDGAKAYLAGNIELDRALELLLKKLSESGKLEDTVIALTADHYPYALEKEDILSLTGGKIHNSYDYYESVFVIYDGQRREKVDMLCSSVDILPTLSNMLGLSFDSRMLMGRDIFSSAESVVIMRDSSWLTEKVYYNASLDLFSVRHGQSADENYRRTVSNTVINRVNCSRQITESDYYAKIFS